MAGAAKIMLVDNETQRREDLAAKLIANGAEVAQFNNYQDAFNKIRRFMPDAVVCHDTQIGMLSPTVMLHWKPPHAAAIVIRPHGHGALDRKYDDITHLHPLEADSKVLAEKILRVADLVATHRPAMSESRSH